MVKTISPPPKERRGIIRISVRDKTNGVPIRNAYIKLFREADGAQRFWPGLTNESGEVTFTMLPGGHYYALYANARRESSSVPVHVEIGRLGEMWEIRKDIDVVTDIQMVLSFLAQGEPRQPDRLMVGDTVQVEMRLADTGDLAPPPGFHYEPVYPLASYGAGGDVFRARIRHADLQQVSMTVRMDPITGEEDDGMVPPPASMLLSGSFEAEEKEPLPVTGNIGVSLSRSETEPTPDLALWVLIRNSTDALSFNNYQAFLDNVFCGSSVIEPRGFEGVRFPAKREAYKNLLKARALPFTDSEAYRVLKAATEAFVMVNCGVLTPPLAFNQSEDEGYLDRRDIPAFDDLEGVLRERYLESLDENNRVLPYLALIRRKLPDVQFQIPHTSMTEADLCFGIIQERLTNPCLLELIWSYWHEEGMLAQSMNVITRRFQNLRSPGDSVDPLANMEIDMLRPLNNLLWGYTQDEQHRLTVVRRNYEYDHHYGIRLDGKAVRAFRPADSRSKFLESFHQLLRMLTAFYRQDDDTTVKADAFPILNALKEVHLILSEGAHNQYGDLPSTARIEMLMQQWMLARPEFREFLPTRTMVAYPEPWMDRVDAMKKIQGWTDTSVVHFRNLATFGEQLLLSIRYGHWSDVVEPTQAFNWARFWRPQAQGYIHAYRAATGVDLSADVVMSPGVDATLPSVLLRQRLEEQQRKA